MKPVFTAEDFDLGEFDCDCGDCIAKQANARLAPLVEALERLDAVWDSPDEDYVARHITAKLVAAFRALRKERP